MLNSETEDRTHRAVPTQSITKTGLIGYSHVSVMMVEANGIEPMTYGLQSRRSPS